MKYLVNRLLKTILVYLSSIGCVPNDKKNDAKDIIEDKIRHVVLFKYKNEVTQLQKDKVINDFVKLKDSKRNGKKYICSIEYGFPNSKEELDRGYEIAFIVTFKNIEDRDYYVGRPHLTKEGTFDLGHDQFKKDVRSLLDISEGTSDNTTGVLVYDFVIKY